MVVCDMVTNIFVAVDSVPEHRLDRVDVLGGCRKYEARERTNISGRWRGEGKYHEGYDLSGPYLSGNEGVELRR